MKSRKSILIYIDEPNWIFDFMAKSIIENYSHKFDIYFDYCCFHKYNKKSIPWGKTILIDFKRFLKNILYLSQLRINEVDLSIYSLFPNQITPFWQTKKSYKGKQIKRRIKPSFFSYDAIVYLDFYYQHYSKISNKSKVKIKGIFTDGFPPDGLSGDVLHFRKYGVEFKPFSVNEFLKRYFSGVDILICGSDLILKRYQSFFNKSYFVNFIYRSEIFSLRKHRIEKKDSLTIGWTGNPNREFKNFYSVVVPAIEILKSMEVPVKFVTRFSGNYLELPDFYKSIDLIIIASVGDAGPSMFAEASLSGIPSISTKIGFPEMVIEDGLNGLLFDGSISELVNKIILLVNNQEILFSFSQRIRDDYLTKLSDKILIRNWGEVFDQI